MSEHRHCWGINLKCLECDEYYPSYEGQQLRILAEKDRRIAELEAEVENLNDKAIKTLARELYIADTLHAMWRADPLWWQGTIRKDYYQFRLAMIANQDLGLECEEIKPFIEQARGILK